MNDFLICCNCTTFCTENVLNLYSVWIIGVICVAILLVVMSFLIFFYKKSNKRIELEKENRQLKENLNKKVNELKKAQDELNKLDKNKIKEEEKIKDFFDYCYKMAKSLDKGNEKQREDCWRIILHNNLDCIPDEMKKEYNIIPKTDSK